MSREDHGPAHGEEDPASRRRLLAAWLFSLLMHLLLLADPLGFMPSAWLAEPAASPLATGERLHAVLRPTPVARPPIRPPTPRPVAPAAPAVHRSATLEVAASEPSPATTPLIEPVEMASAPATEARPEPAPESMPDPTVTAPEAVGPTASSATAPPDVAEPRLKATLRFTVTRGEGGLEIGEAIHHIELADGQYRLSADLATTGLAALLRPARARQLSIGRYQNGVLTPLTFRNERQNESEEAQFDWSAGLLHLADGRAVPLPAGTQDLLSLFYQLAFESAATLDLPVATARKLERRRFENLGLEPLTTALGERLTLHWRMRAEQGASEVWIDSATRLPIKMRLIDHRGDLYQQLIETMSVDSGAPP